MTDTFDTGADVEMRHARVALVDLLDRVLAGGVVVAGEVTLCVADVELVHVSLRLLLSSVSALAENMPDAPVRGRVL